MIAHANKTTTNKKASWSLLVSLSPSAGATHYPADMLFFRCATPWTPDPDHVHTLLVCSHHCIHLPLSSLAQF
jgi:hypothetical protein